MRSVPSSDAKPNGRPGLRRHQREILREPCAEGVLVVGGRDPGRLLRLTVILASEFLDAGAEYFRQRSGVGGQTRAAARVLGRRGPSAGGLPPPPWGEVETAEPSG